MKIWNLAYSVTNSCNLRCKHCYANSGIAYEDELTVDEISNKILDEAEKIGTKFVTLTGGEPFAREDIFQIIQEIKRRGIRVCIASNGMLLDEEKISSLKALDVDRIQISLEGPTAEYNDIIRGKGVFEKNVNEIIPLLKQAGLFVAISLTPTINNYQTLPQMAELCASLGVDSFSIRRFADEGRGKENKLNMNKEENIQLLDSISKLREEYQSKLKISTGDPLYILVDERRDEYIKKPLLGGCTAGITSLAIDATGNIKPCTRSNEIIGNVKFDNLSEIWEKHPLLMQLRHRNELNGKCAVCKYKMLCGGCRVCAEKFDNSLFGEDSHCWV